MIALIDNYDSFSYNLYQLMGEACERSGGEEIRVIRNDGCTVDELRDMAPTHIVLSPGPGYPRDAGICIDVARELGPDIPTLGVCLGHQSICEAFGGTVTHARQLMHGKSSEVTLDTTSPLFAGFGERVVVGRYHSLAVLRENLPACLEVIAETDDGEVMAVQHRRLPIYGVQFHPESILTPQGGRMLENFLGLRWRADG